MTSRRNGARAPRSPAVAAFLSFLWPGLGHWYLGRPRAAALLALPLAALALVLIVWLLGGLDRAIVDLLAPPVAVGLTVAFIVAGIWRIGSMSHATLLAGGPRALRQPATAGTFVALALLVAVTHLWAAAVSWSIYRGSELVFDPGPGPVVQLPIESGAPTPGDPFEASPMATPPTRDARINILLTGIDASELRRTTLTDTLIVVSLDPETGESAMVSFPRDIARFTMSNGVRYTGKINSLMTYANNHPDQYPAGGLQTLIQELGFILGVPIHYFAAVDLDGFRGLIDAMGGIDIDNPKAINDPSYAGWSDGHRGFRLSAGNHHLDGEHALAYARSRKGAGDTDFTRSRRQQQILVALRTRLTDPKLLPKLPGLITIASETLKTNFPRDRVGEVLDIARELEGEDSIRSLVLGPPYAVSPPAGTPGGYQLVLDLERIAKLSIELFGDASSYAVSR